MRRRSRSGCRGIRDQAIDFVGVDPVYEPIPIMPSQHYSMGGIDIDADGATESPGSTPAASAPASSVHGANRLGGNSLLETIVFGRRAGAAAAAFIAGGGAGAADGAATARAAAAALAAMRDRVDRLRHGSEQPYAIRADMIATMKEHFGVFRDEQRMAEGLEKMRALKERARHVKLMHGGDVFNLDLIRTIELEAMVDVALATATGALKRTESRGSHARTDHPDRDDVHWLKHTLAYYEPGGPRLESKPVTLGMFEPQERRY